MKRLREKELQQRLQTTQSQLRGRFNLKMDMVHQRSSQYENDVNSAEINDGLILEAETTNEVTTRNLVDDS